MKDSLINDALFRHAFLTAMIIGVLCRFFLLRVKDKQYPSRPQDYLEQIIVAGLAASLGAIALPALIDKEFSALTFLAVGIQQFQSLSNQEKITLENIDYEDMVEKGAPYIDNISSTYEVRSYVSLFSALVASIIYILNQVVCVGILGDSLSSTSTPVADAARICFGNMGAGLVTFGTLVSVGGICMCGAFVNPRSCVALADDKMLPRIFARKDKKGTPYVAIIATMLITIPIALSGSFAELAAISAVARFIQYIPTSLSVLVFRKKRPELVGTFKTPFGAVIPLIAVCVGTWLLFQASMHQLIMGLGALAIGVPLYFIMKSYNRKVYGENLKKIV